MNFEATYSPDDNKLRLVASSRLPKDLYERVKAAGFRWAPKQEQFIAPRWTPAGADLCIELAGEIGDDDVSLVDRAEERAERFEGYSESRTADAESARAAVAAIADHIPLGQPILIGHHSEKRARKDAEKIQNGMRKAVQMWDTAKYWTYRASAAIAHAKYKERPDVRARRISGIEADKRKAERAVAEATKFNAIWQKEGLTHERAVMIANHDHVSKCFTLEDFPRDPKASQYEGMMSLWSALETNRNGEEHPPIITAEQARDIAVRVHNRTIEYYSRWIQHYENRLAYERAMLAEGGGLVATTEAMMPGGYVRRHRSTEQWFMIIKVNPQSVTVNGHFARTIPNDEIAEYKAPTEEAYERAKKIKLNPPLCNYPGEGFLQMTKAEYDARAEKRWSDFPKTQTIAATDTQARHRTPCARKKGDQWGVHCVFITDAKVKMPPAPTKSEPIPAPPMTMPAPKPVKAENQVKTGADFEAMRDTLKQGVKIVTAPQLFPTPPDLAARMVELSGAEAGDLILEPSGGSGAIIKEIVDTIDTEIVSYEINSGLCAHLTATFPSYRLQARCKDFLEVTEGQGQFAAVIMNPPFANGADIKHIEHARTFLRPGGKLVAICANGPRQREKLMPLADLWEDLPAGTFKEAGTGVNTALLVIQA